MNTIEKAARYLAKCEPSIAGQNGSGQAFYVAAILTRDFALSISDALPLMLDWNERCQPPWTESELLHKLKDASEKSTKPLGSKSKPSALSPHKPSATADNPTSKPDRSGFNSGTLDDVLKLTAARPFHREGLLLAQERGLLVFGQWWDFHCYGLTDQSGRVLEIRRMDGQLFPAHGKLDERKSHSVKNSSKKWPVGILEAKPFPTVALVEGIPDFLTATYETMWEGKAESCAVVGMLSASPAIAADALPYFTGKHVRIFPHIDQAGIDGAAKWQAQLINAGATVDFFDFGRYKKTDGETVNDFYESLHAAAGMPERIMP